LAEITGTGETGLTARYASALYALAFEQNALNEVVEQMEALGRLIASSAPLKHLLANPLTDTAKARPALNEALMAEGFGPLVRNFVNVAVANRRLRDLPVLIAGFARLAEAGYGNVRLVEHTDPSLLGGLVLKVGAKIFDTSLKSRLNRLNYSLKGAA